MPISDHKKTGRPRVSCAECRRSKLKCNKEIPCSECLRRGCAAVCPRGVMASRPSIRRLLEENSNLRAKLQDQIDHDSESESASDLAPSAPSSGSSIRHPYHSYQQSPRMPEVPTVGHLSIEAGGRSRFFGPAAAAHLLPDEEQLDEPPERIDHTYDISSYNLLGPLLPFPFSTRDSRVRYEVYEQAKVRLPSRADWERLSNIHWTSSSWRFQPVTQETVDEIAGDVFAGRRRSLAELAVIFGVLAFGCLFDETLETHSLISKEYNALSLQCLAAADFLTNTSVTTLATLHLHCCFLLNGDRPRSDEIYAIVGLALRLAQIAGFHRDGRWWHLSEKAANTRRRTWWELLTLERINAIRFGFPPFISSDQYDAIRPTDQPPDSYLFWRWEWDDCLNDLMRAIADPVKARDLDVIKEVDTGARAFFMRLPEHLQSKSIKLGDRRQPAALTSDPHDLPVVIRMQQVRLGLHFSTGIQQLHRAAFAEALKAHPLEPLDSPYRDSVLAMIQEGCGNVLALADDLVAIAPSVLRHTVLALDLFTSLVPQAALVIRSPSSQLSAECQQRLLRGVQLLELAQATVPCEWYSVILARGQKLVHKATNRLSAYWSEVLSKGGSVPKAGGEDVDEMLGNVTRLHEKQSSMRVNAPTDAQVRQEQEEQLREMDIDFDRWLNALWTDAPDYNASGFGGINLDGQSGIDALLGGANFSQNLWPVEET